MSDTTTIIRPSAILPEAAARAILRELEAHDVSKGGVWNASPGLWIRYDKPWDGKPMGPGTAKKLGTIGAMYGSPSRYEITVYRATLTEDAMNQGWTIDGLVDDALKWGDLTLASCPRASLSSTLPDPFRKS